jgi:Mor family transcriptional regulator
MKKKVFLTKEQKVNVIAKHNRGETAAELAKNYNVSVSTIFNILKPHQRKERKEVTPKTIKKFKELRNAGKSYSDISKLTGYAQSTISRHIGGSRTPTAEQTEAVNGGSMYLSKPICALIEALKYEGESVPSVIIRALKALAETEKDFDKTQEGIEELNEARDAYEADHSMTTERGRDSVNMIGMALITAAVMALLFALGLDSGVWGE